MSLSTWWARCIGRADTTKTQEVADRLVVTADRLDAAVADLEATLKWAEERRDAT